MLICKGEKSYKCGRIKAFTVGERYCMHFSILDSISPVEIANLFSDNDFYFYDDILNGRLPDTKNTKTVGIRIIYNEDFTREIKIILLKGVIEDES